MLLARARFGRRIVSGVVEGGTLHAVRGVVAPLAWQNHCCQVMTLPVPP